MELRHLRYFVAVAEELHFARAARRLHIVQPALSMQIKALEEELGTRLLERTRRHVELTEAGRLFLEEARQTLEQAERAARVAKRAGRGELGRIELGYSVNAAYSGVLAGTLKAFRQRAPDIEVRLHELHAFDQREALLEGRIHVGFITAPGLRLPPELAGVRVGAWPLMVALPSDHPLARRERIPAKLLVEEPFVDFTGAKDEQGLPLMQRLGGFSPRIRYRSTNIMAVISLVAAGFGVALVPASIVPLDIGGGVAYRPLTGVTEVMELLVAYRRNEKAPVVRAFLEVLRARP
ncbi:LysR family transcriptional regulator [Pyxidicoccus fallax]|uniref:LysR family transcriptional regulator n=1 Tax=Pyxidicoccus fallax TaxID=394095 RepID=A0A848LEE2_9BACT|nr:LysR substrate-binding domain-containing protein [Pyxidicoccus fallax]NMO14601.1 LysR family transcriptional regulator [Pyxidicoccus fallax]NPC77365.1 LysR family transcriptional regulator [Pyxidicoccus fallax]